MKLKTKLLFAVPILLLIIGVASTNAYAWDGGYGPGGCGWDNCGNYGRQPVCGGFCAGEQDAQYDLQNNLQYNPIGQCLPCHSDYYWSNFHAGYDHQWNTYQSQESNQGSSINIYGNNNYVSTNQYSNQQQNPLQQLAHTVCGWINCNQQTGYGSP